MKARGWLVSPLVAHSGFWGEGTPAGAELNAGLPFAGGLSILKGLGDEP
jgi:hypothetical protein